MKESRREREKVGERERRERDKAGGREREGG